MNGRLLLPNDRQKGVAVGRAAHSRFDDRNGWKAVITLVTVSAMEHAATLHLFFGRIGSGKSTLAAELAADPKSILISEDQLLASMYPGEIQTIEDYARCSDRLRTAISSCIVDLLRKGLSVVLDFQANTIGVRAWMRGLIESADCEHQLHFLRTAESVCKERLALRNASGLHQYHVSDADFDLFNRYVVAPDASEGFNIVTHD